MYTGKEKTVIPREDAKTNITATIQNRHADFDSTYFSQDALQDLLKVDGAVGVRFYNGRITKDGKFYKTLIAVAVDADGKDLTEGGEVLLGEWPCPYDCPGDGGGMWP